MEIHNSEPTPGQGSQSYLSGIEISEIEESEGKNKNSQSYLSGIEMLQLIIWENQPLNSQSYLSGIEIKVVYCKRL